MMISRRNLAERNLRNYGCKERVEERFVEPIDDEKRLVRRPSRRTPEQEIMMKQKMKAADRDNDDDDDDAKKKPGILKLPHLSTESKRMALDLPQQPYKSVPYESTRWTAGRNLRWNDEDIETTGSSSGRRRAVGLNDIEEDLSELARIKEEVRKTVQSRMRQRLASDALIPESERVSAMAMTEVQSCPDIRSAVDDGLQEHARNQTSVRSSEPREAVESDRRQPPDAMTQHLSRLERSKHPLPIRTALASDAREEQVPRRIRGRSLDPYEHTPSDRRDVSVPSRSSLSRKRKKGHDRKADVSAGPSSYDRRDQSLCTCSWCEALGKESPDSRRERLLLQERWDARVWHELRSLLQAMPMTTTARGRRQLSKQSAKSSSSNEAMYGCPMSRRQMVNHTGTGRDVGSAGSGGIVGKREGRGPASDKMTQTEDSCTRLRAGALTQMKKAPSGDLTFSHLRSPGEKDESGTVDRGCQAAADHEELDAHKCDSSITDATSIWPSTSGSGTQQGLMGVTAITTSSVDACRAQEYNSLLQSISAELLTMSVSAESLRAAIGATTGGRPLDENSVLEAIDREMADVSHFVKDTLDLSEIKPKEYVQVHMSILKKFTSNLEQFLSEQKPKPNLD